MLEWPHEALTEVVTGFGRKGLPAETVARETPMKQDYLKANARWAGAWRISINLFGPGGGGRFATSDRLSTL
jgi:hypothetical protein